MQGGGAAGGHGAVRRNPGNSTQTQGYVTAMNASHRPSGHRSPAIMKYRTILMFGAPGSGKGTQGKILGAIPGFFPLRLRRRVPQPASGQSARQNLSSNTPAAASWCRTQPTIELWRQCIDASTTTGRFHPADGHARARRHPAQRGTGGDAERHARRGRRVLSHCARPEKSRRRACSAAPSRKTGSTTRTSTSSASA